MNFTEWKEKYIVQPEKMRYNIFNNVVQEELKSYSASMHTGNQASMFVVAITSILREVSLRPTCK